MTCLYYDIALTCLRQNEFILLKIILTAEKKFSSYENLKFSF